MGGYKVVVSRFEREVNSMYDTLVPDTEPVVRYIRNTEEAVGPVVQPSNKDERRKMSRKALVMSRWTR